MRKRTDNTSSGHQDDNQQIDRKRTALAKQQLINKQGQPVISASKLRGMTVENEEGDQLGVLSELMIEMQRGTVAYAILRFEDDKSFAIPYSMLRIDLDAMTIHANVQREVFEHGRGMQTKSNENADRQG